MTETAGMERYESETSSGSTALAHRARVAFPERVRVSTKAALLPGRYPLPPEVSESAVWRLAAIALAFSVSSVAVWFVGQRLDIGSIDPDHAPPSYSTSLILGALLGLVMAAGAAWSIRSGKPPSLTLRFGLAFQILGGLLIAIAENHILVQICSSLTEAHESGIIHRDIKPRNILLCRLGASFDVVKVLDFALPRVLHDSSQAVSEIAKEGEVFGKPAFMAPELVTGEGVADQSSDIYALGCVAYWLLSGETVSQARSVVAMALAHVREDPQPVSLRAEFDIPPALDDLILACLDRDCARTGVCPGGDGSASCPPIGSPLDAGAGRAMVAREPSASSAGCRQRSSVASGLAGRRRSKTPLVAGACRGKPSHRCGKWSNPAAGKMWSSQV